MRNVKYELSDDKKVVYGHLSNGIVFMISPDKFYKIKDIDFYLNSNDRKYTVYIIDKEGIPIHRHIMNKRKGFMIDHINLNTFDNRNENLRFCTHQQNMINRSLQKNNTSGITGVSYYQPRKKFRARIKISKQDIHLGYYDTFEDAIKARNVAMKCMFGQYGRYNDVDEIPKWIQSKVIEKCARFSHLTEHSAFFDFWEVKDE